MADRRALVSSLLPFVVAGFATACARGITQEDGTFDPAIDAGSPVAPDATRPDAVSPDADESPRCGDGWLDPGEQCDDGNVLPGDGCSAGCTIDCEWGCGCSPALPCAPIVVCGDGRLDVSEVCDDGNNLGGDGCSADCRINEPGWDCRPGRPCEVIVPADLPCGDGVVDPGEQCDEGPANNEPGYAGCTTRCTLGPYCGDGIVQTVYAEQCDNGVNDGLSSACSPECRILLP